jgi:hypothetical protein
MADVLTQGGDQDQAQTNQANQQQAEPEPQQAKQQQEPQQAGLTTDAGQLQNNAHGVRLAGQAKGLTAKLPPDQRTALIMETNNNLLRAYTAYSNATHNQRAALKAAADDSSEFVLALIEVGLGVAVPGLGRLASASIRALGSAPKAAALLKSIVNAPEFGGLITAVTKEATISAKPGLPSAKQHDSDESFLVSLQKSFGDAVASVQGQLPTMSDEAIAAVCSRFDRASANEETYGSAVNQMVMTMRALQGSFEKHNKQFGGGARADSDRYRWTEEDLIVYVGDHDDPNNPLAVAEEVRGGTPSLNRPDGYYLKRRIPETMRASAVEMCQVKKNRHPHRVHPTDLRGW